MTSFPEPGRKWQASQRGGNHATWRQNGRELYYRTPDGLYAVEVDGAGDTFVVGVITRLFDLPPKFTPGRDYDPTADGQRFIIHQPAEQTELPPITLVLNWDAELP